MSHHCKFTPPTPLSRYVVVVLAVSAALLLITCCILIDRTESLPDDIAAVNHAHASLDKEIKQLRKDVSDFERRIESSGRSCSKSFQLRFREQAKTNARLGERLDAQSKAMSTNTRNIAKLYQWVGKWVEWFGKQKHCGCCE